LDTSAPSRVKGYGPNTVYCIAPPQTSTTAWLSQEESFTGLGTPPFKTRKDGHCISTHREPQRQLSVRVFKHIGTEAVSPAEQGREQAVDFPKPSSLRRRCRRGNSLKRNRLKRVRVP